MDDNEENEENEEIVFKLGNEYYTKSEISTYFKNALRAGPNLDTNDTRYKIMMSILSKDNEAEQINLSKLPQDIIDKLAFNNRLPQIFILNPGNEQTVGVLVKRQTDEELKKLAQEQIKAHQIKFDEGLIPELESHLEGIKSHPLTLDAFMEVGIESIGTEEERRQISISFIPRQQNPNNNQASTPSR